MSVGQPMKFNCYIGWCLVPHWFVYVLTRLK